MGEIQVQAERLRVGDVIGFPAGLDGTGTTWAPITRVSVCWLDSERARGVVNVWRARVDGEVSVCMGIDAGTLVSVARCEDCTSGDVLASPLGEDGAPVHFCQACLVSAELGPVCDSAIGYVIADEGEPRRLTSWIVDTGREWVEVQAESEDDALELALALIDYPIADGFDPTVEPDL